MPPFLGAILNLIMGPLLDKLLSTGADMFKAYENKQISQMQLREQLGGLVQQAFVDVSKSANDAVTKTYASFMDTLKTTKIVQYVWAYWVASQITFLVWLELGVPYFNQYYGLTWHVGALDQWAYAGVMAALGLGPLVLKAIQPKPPTI